MEPGGMMRRLAFAAVIALASACCAATARAEAPGASLETRTAQPPSFEVPGVRSFEARMIGEGAMPVLVSRDFDAAPVPDEKAGPLTRPSMLSALALPVSSPALAASTGTPAALTAQRAQILLRSLTIPGWGQATLGRTKSATAFGLIEAGIWGSFVAFQVQDRLRTGSYERSARVTAGIDLSDRDEEFRRIVGSFLSSDEYNLYVVARDAANQHYDDPAAMQAYIDANSLRGPDTWAWPDDEGLLRYREQRKDAQRAQQRANTTLAVAVANRLVSALHAARVANRPASKPSGWRLDVSPGPEGDFTAVQVGVRTRF